MIWAPCAVILFYGVTLFFDLGRLKDLDEEETKIDDNDSIVSNETKNISKFEFIFPMQI